MTDRERIIYRMVDTAGISEKALREMFYSFTGTCWEKSLPLSSLMYEHDIQILQDNYNRFIKKELSASRTLRDFEDTLYELIIKNASAGIRWWLTGSAALYIRGFDVRPHDIDIMTYLTEKEKIIETFGDLAVEPFHYPENWVVKGFGVIDPGYRVDVAFEPQEWVDDREPIDFGPYAEKHLESVLWKGLTVLVPLVELHLPSNTTRQRIAIVNQIRERLNRPVQ